MQTCMCSPILHVFIHALQNFTFLLSAIIICFITSAIFWLNLCKQFAILLCSCFFTTQYSSKEYFLRQLAFDLSKVFVKLHQSKSYFFHSHSFQSLNKPKKVEIAKFFYNENFFIINNSSSIYICFTTLTKR